MWKCVHTKHLHIKSKQRCSWTWTFSISEIANQQIVKMFQGFMTPIHKNIKTRRKGRDWRKIPERTAIFGKFWDQSESFTQTHVVSVSQVYRKPGVQFCVHLILLDLYVLCLLICLSRFKSGKNDLGGDQRRGRPLLFPFVVFLCDIIALNHCPPLPVVLLFYSNYNYGDYYYYYRLDKTMSKKMQNHV